MIDFSLKYNEYLNFFEKNLNTYLDNYVKSLPKILSDAINYAIKDGGKRIRPVLCLAVAEMLNVNLDDAVYYAMAVEMIHSYSLVHDDLPSMDNDDYRRGKLSTHKKFGEAYGILAGDALLNLAFETCLNKPNFNKNDANAVKVLSEYAGSKGMVGGQVLDLLCENKDNLDEKTLFEIYLNKTSKLITAPILISSCLADNLFFNELSKFGECLGLLFQVVDDFIDIEQDKIENKFTSVKLYGLDGAKLKAKEYYDKCISILKPIKNSEFLIEFTNKMYKREK